jgi:hypothetical protein
MWVSALYIFTVKSYFIKNIFIMPTISIDGNDYNLDDLSQSAKEKIASLKFAQDEIKRLDAQKAIYSTAASAYSNALKQELSN